MSGSPLLIRRAEINGSLYDVRLAGGRVASLEPSLRRHPSGIRNLTVIDADGGALLPGLHDHHIHLMAMAAAKASVDVGPPAVNDRSSLALALRGEHQRLAAGRWIRATGYHESVAGDIDRDALDSLGIDRPVRVQHRSGAEWVLNTQALEAIRVPDDAPAGVERDASGAPTGRFFRVDLWLRQRMPLISIDLGSVGRKLASYGITGVTDLTPTVDSADLMVLSSAIANGELQLDVTVTGSADLPAATCSHLQRGPVKVIIEDHDLPGIDWIVSQFEGAHRLDRPVAVHVVTREAVLLAMAAWGEAGVRRGDRLEHGAIIPSEVLEELAGLEVIVVTQPSFVRNRGDRYLADVDGADRGDLWRCGSLIAEGIPVAFGSDAPYGDPDPWVSISAAVERRTLGGQVMGIDESIDAVTALGCLLGTPTQPMSRRSVQVGEWADLCLLDRPLKDQLSEPTSAAVAATIRSGELIFRR